MISPFVENSLRAPLLGEESSVLNFDGCRLCWALSPKGQLSHHNTILLETDDYVVMPARGSLTPGYLMLVSKEHRGSLASLQPGEANEFPRQFDSVMRVIKQVSTDWTAFEHGSLEDHAKACCIDHLHVHLLPLGFDLTEAVGARLKSVIDRGPSDKPPWMDTTLSGNYLWVMRNGRHAVFSAEYYPRQLVRQIIAERLDIPGVWDWREHVHPLNTRNTILKFRSLGLCHREVYLAHAVENSKPADTHSSVGRLRAYLTERSTGARLVSPFQELMQSGVEPVGPGRGVDDIQLVATELSLMLRGDAVLVDLSKGDHHYVGALMEIVYANQFGLPVIVWAIPEIARRRWLRAHATKVTTDAAEAVDCIAELLLGM